MCNCSTALYITLIPVAFALVTLFLAIVIIHFKEVADTRRRRIQKQSETLIRGLMNFCSTAGLIHKDHVYFSAVERFAKEHNKQTQVLKLKGHDEE